jgi:TonB family protein
LFENINGRRRSRDEKVAQGTAVSVALHALILLLLFWGVGESSYLLANEQPGTGPSDGPAGGGGGGGREEQVTYYEIPVTPAAPPVPVVPTPEDVVLPQTPPPPVTQPELPQECPAPTPTPPAPTPAGNGGAGAGDGGGQGAGAGPGEGPGSGGGTGGGNGGGIGSGNGPGTGGGNGTIVPPSTDLILLPPQKPSGMRTQEVTIRFYVNRRGKVTRVDVLNSTGNRRYDDELRRRMAEYEFTPARDTRTGEAVDAATDITITI